MKKTLFLAILSLMMTLSASAQRSVNGRYYNPSSGRTDYKGSSAFDRGFLSEGLYYGFRIGPAFSTIASKDNDAKASGTFVGMNLGGIVGKELTDTAPLYLESGLFYTRKGGNAKSSGKDVSYSLDYLTIPVIFKYGVDVDDDFQVLPFFGLYGSLGVGGKERRAADQYQGSVYDKYDHFDAGLRMGCGVSFSPFYAEVLYDLGLTDIRDYYEPAHTRSFQINFGVNF